MANCDWRSLMRSYATYVSPSSIVLEIGASSAEKTRELALRCRKLIGVELMPERTPKSFDHVEYITGDWQNLTSFLEPNSVDVAVSSHVIEHVIDDTKALNELYKVLRPGGVALINTPNRKRLPRAIIEFLSKERQFPYWEHQREYVEGDLMRLISSSPFAKHEIKAIVLGLHGGPIYFYIEDVPRRFRKYANFWEIHLFK